MIVKVLLVTDDKAMIAHIQAEGVQADMDIDDIAMTINQCIAFVSHKKYDAVVIDADLYGSLEALQCVRTEQPDVSIIVFSKSNDMRRHMLKHGARAYFTTNLGSRELSVEQLIIERIELCAACGGCHPLYLP
jgi:DNA-binding NarL/FixJ family response regulator